MPSRRPQISATERAFAAVSVKPGRARRDRSVNSCTASNRPSSSLLSCASTGKDSDGHPPGDLPQHPERLAAGGQKPKSRARQQEPLGDLGAAAGAQVLAVVQYQQQGPVAGGGGEAVQAAGGTGSRNRQRRGDSAGNLAGTGQRCELNRPHPVRQAADAARCRVPEQPPLAAASRAGQRHQAVPGQQAGHLGKLVTAADEAGQLHRQVVASRAPECAAAGKDARKSGWLSCHRCSGGPRSGSRCQPRSDRPAPVGQAAGHQVGCLLGQHDLAGRSAVPHAVAMVHRRSVHVALRPGVCLAAVQGQPRQHGVVGQLALQRQRAAGGPRGTT